MSSALRSVIVCTRNRSERLCATLDSLAALQSAAPLELILVDNGSTDGTRRVLEEFQARCPLKIANVYEPTPGLSRARNTGVAAASGMVVLFTDDDVTVPPTWADALSAPIETDRAVATVGEINIAPHLRRPWMTDSDVAFFVSTVSVGDRKMPNLIGASMALSRETLLGLGGFDEDLGVGGRIGGGEDLILTQLIRDLGQEIEFVPGAAVTHNFDPIRLTVHDRLNRLRGYSAYQAWLRWHYFGLHTPLAALKAVALSPFDSAIRRFARTSEGRPHPLAERIVVACSFYAQAAREERNERVARYAAH